MLPRIKVYEVWSCKFEAPAPFKREGWTSEKLAEFAAEKGLDGDFEIFENKKDAFKFFEERKGDCHTRFFRNAGARYIQFDYLCIMEAEYEEDASVDDIEWSNDIGIVADYVAEVKGE